MKIVFEKFYKRSIEEGEEHLATSPALPSGKAAQVSNTAFAIVDLPADLTTLVEMTREEWTVAKKPIGIEIHWDGEPVEPPVKRKLTPEEENLDREYQTRLLGARADRMRSIRDALSDSTCPLVEIETTTTTGYSSVPLMSALSHLLAPDPDPIDPIPWCRSAAKTNKLSMWTSLIGMAVPIVEKAVNAWASVKSQPRSVRAEVEPEVASSAEPVVEPPTAERPREADEESR